MVSIESNRRSINISIFSNFYYNLKYTEKHNFIFSVQSITTTVFYVINCNSDDFYNIEKFRSIKFHFLFRFVCIFLWLSCLQLMWNSINININKLHSLYNTVVCNTGKCLLRNAMLHYVNIVRYNIEFKFKYCSVNKNETNNFNYNKKMLHFTIEYAFKSN